MAKRKSIRDGGDIDVGKLRKAAAKLDKPAKTAKPKLAAIDLDQQQATFFRHKRALAPLLADFRAVQADLKKAYELAKAEGIAKKDLDLAFRLDTDDGEAKAKLDLQSMMRVARWVGASIGTQGDLFGDKAESKHYADGKRAGLQGERRSPPSHIGAIADVDQWFAGYDVGVKAYNAIESVGRGADAKAAFVETIGG